MHIIAFLFFSFVDLPFLFSVRQIYLLRGRKILPWVAAIFLGPVFGYMFMRVVGNFAVIIRPDSEIDAAFLRHELRLFAPLAIGALLIGAALWFIALYRYERELSGRLHRWEKKGFVGACAIFAAFLIKWLCSAGDYWNL